MRTALRWFVVAVVCSTAALEAVAASGAQFAAYSLKAAERRMKQRGRSDTDVLYLGGITRIAGMVYDPESKDLVLVGQAVPGEEKISLDELVVAMRALSVHRQWPAVSIDRTADTETTQMQAVRYEGGIAHTLFGKKFLDADVTLKRLALGKLKADILRIQSYFDLSVADTKKNGTGDNINTRFWFYALEPALAVKDGVFAIKELRIGVRTQVMGVNGKQVKDLSQVHDTLGDSFAEAITNCQDIGVHFPEVARLKALFDLVAVAKGIQLLPMKPELDYWLTKYEMPEVDTPEHYQFIRSEARPEVGKTTYHIQIDGGVQLKALLIRLRDGDVTALRDAVLKTRPATDALTWKVRLPGWHIPGHSESDVEDDTYAENSLPNNFSCTINKTVARDGSAPLKNSFFEQPLSSRFPKFDISNGLPRQQYSPHIGGVMLSGAAKVEGAGRAQVNLAGGNFSLVVDGKNARIAPEAYRKFITALWCVYYCDQDPGISIDPIGKESEKHLVRYIGRVINTDLGRVMREADYIMKKWAVGTERPDYPGFRAVDGWMAQYGAARTGVSRRFWFVPEELSFKRGGDLLLFGSGRIRLNTEYDVDGLRGQASKADEQFAGFFTRHYANIAEKHPVFKELFEYAKMVALAKYLKEQGVPLHWFLLAHKDLVITEDSPGSVDQLAKGSDYYRGMTIMGGVNLKPNSRYVYDREAVAAIEDAVARMPSVSLQETQMATGEAKVRRVPRRFSFDVGKQSYSVVPQHTLTSGKDHRGIRYQTDLALRQDGRPGLELVRYYNPRNRSGGEFGKGWHLLIPYRVKPADDATREFLNAVIPQRMVVENLSTGQREVLSFSEDRYSAAGYVPDKLESSQVVGLFLMSNASYRLADKLGNQFHFDQAGYLIDMFLSPSGDHHVHVEYVDDYTAAFTKTPYVVRPMGNEKVAFLNAMVPKQVKVTDLVHGDSEVLSFNDTNRIPGYMPSGDKASRYRLLAILSNAGLQLIDKHGNQTVFDPGWKFCRMLPSRELRIVRSISMGGQKVTFGYTINGSGEVIIASSSLSANTPGAPLAHVVRYEHDTEGRLCRVRHSPQVYGLQDQAERDNDLVMSGK